MTLWVGHLLAEWPSALSIWILILGSKEKRFLSGAWGTVSSGRNATGKRGGISKPLQEWWAGFSLSSTPNPPSLGRGPRTVTSLRLKGKLESWSPSHPGSCLKIRKTRAPNFSLSFFQYGVERYTGLVTKSLPSQWPSNLGDIAYHLDLSFYTAQMELFQLWSLLEAWSLPNFLNVDSQSESS